MGDLCKVSMLEVIPLKNFMSGASIYYFWGKLAENTTGSTFPTVMVSTAEFELFVQPKIKRDRTVFTRFV